MAKKLCTISRKTWDKLEKFDYGDLYSAHEGMLSGYWEDDDAVEIFIGVNRYGRLFINVNLYYGEYHRTFNFDELREAIDWVKRRVEVAG